MPQRDAARTTRATTARTAVPGTPGGPGAAGAGPAPVAATPVPPPAAPPGPPPAPVAPGQGDARALARASLAAGRSPSLWWVCTGVVVALVVTVAAGPEHGAAVLAGLLAASALARAVLRPGPVALTVRSRALDSATLATLALGVGLLSQLIPTR